MHGTAVVVVQAPGEHAGTAADAAVTDVPGAALCVRTADCAPVVLVAPGAVGVVHAGWRGLVDGVVEGAVAALRTLTDAPLRAHLGPCIRSGCYEFAGAERETVMARFGPTVAATTMWGTPAIDLPAAVAVALEECGVAAPVDTAGCTACDDRWFSHRARRDDARFATVAWIPT